MAFAQSQQTPTASWQDGKRYLWLLSPGIPVLALTLLLIYQFVWSWPVLLWGGPILVYMLIPFADWVIGTDTNNPPESAVQALEDDRYYRLIVYAYIPTQYLATILGAWIVAQGNAPWWGILGLILSVGAVNGIAINTAHELGHKKGSLERWLAKITLAPVAYGHFFVEHNKGHHKNVATPEDPASSRMGESFWQFLPRTMTGSLKSAWDIEAKRLQRCEQPLWSLHNENLQAWLMTVVLFVSLTAVFGWIVLPFLLLQAFYGASLLEVINYMEHYGLLRQKDERGRYERCQPRHSWNSNHIVTNLFLYQLQRHSDHHANPTRRFQALRHFDDSPQLPSGYASMLIPAYLPFVWFKKMDPLVYKHYQGDLSKANLQPEKRTALLAKWRTAPVTYQSADSEPDVDSAALAAAQQAEQEQDRLHQFQCPNCGYIYDERQGEEREGFAPGTHWIEIPDTWSCPDCAVRDKVDFVLRQP
ncbi:MAG: fatty acid desaturase [Pseudomonadota bacterium]|nr:fatty acid desaturase [Pseudomonadota bacterium]MEE3320893.1 fatty acid desaturase [Pseudomonadota bacterium]